ncbi:glycosyl transferase family 28 [Pontibacter sp. KCTC 32443]|uniref:PssE/Cps14G family polysaccharide biosynthesis glycosyltransferase n=1 Tax=Pontibacter TaxID=323449 RepID=UPI00164D426D|nr:MULTISPECIES: PssE/Cps14G family polysaccharide biosynthesis glycosyltransferase [Pontibacter]MBC5773721.1 glycosyl transferase family 28 [Pontibacter sp. KCTC 32443]
MIFITVGTQEPFDRLIAAIDRIASRFEQIDIIAQVAKSEYRARNIKTFPFCSPPEFDALFLKADLIISHAGMGTIISAMEYEKPILVLPRSAKLGEHRNEHQLATAKAFDKLNFIQVAYNESELETKLHEILNGDLKHSHKLNKYASPELIESIRNYIFD